MAEDAQKSSKRGHMFKPHSWFKAKEVRVQDAPTPKLIGIFWSKKLLQLLLSHQREHPVGFNEDEKSKILEDLKLRFRSRPTCWQEVEAMLEHLNIGSTEGVWTADMDNGLIQWLLHWERTPPLTLRTLRETVYKVFNKDVSDTEVFRRIQYLKLNGRLDYEESGLMTGWQDVEMNKNLPPIHFD